MSPTRMPHMDWTNYDPCDLTNLWDPMSSSQSYVDMLTQDTEPELQILTEPPDSSNRWHGGNYSHEEDIQLCWSWDRISNDPRVGTDQAKGTYWNRITEHFHLNRTFDSDRNATSLEKRMATIQRECIKFQECYEQVESARPSGVPPAEYVQLAQKAYGGKKGCPFIHCWMEIRHTEKFKKAYDAIMELKRGPARRRGKSTTPSHEADLGPNSSAQATSEPIPTSRRPPGQKLSKKKARRNDDDDDDDNMGMWGPYLQVKAKEQKKKEERWKSDKELEMRRLDIEECRLLWEMEEKIMFSDESTMDENQRSYLQTMRQDIARKKAALLKGSGGSASFTSDHASGGDGEGASFSSV